MSPVIEAFFDAASHTISYVVSEPNGKHCAIIDPVLNYDPASGCTSTESSDKLVEYVRNQNLSVQWILETHVHADHLTAAPYLAETLGGKVAIGSRITEVQSAFKNLFNAGPEFATDGSQFDHLFEDEECFQIGDLCAKVLFTPGHTPACSTYVIGDAAFVGDTLFMPDFGTARTDFPGGDADALYRSIQRVLALPDETRLFMCHDYLPSGRDHYQWETTVADERNHNIHFGGGVTQRDFVAIRKKRDDDSTVPKLLLPSVQVNMRAGRLPVAEGNGIVYLKIPLDVLY